LWQMMQFAVGQVDSQLAAPMRHLLWLGKPKRKIKIKKKLESPKQTENVIKL